MTLFGRLSRIPPSSPVGTCRFRDCCQYLVYRSHSQGAGRRLRSKARCSLRFPNSNDRCASTGDRNRLPVASTRVSPLCFWRPHYIPVAAGRSADCGGCKYKNPPGSATDNPHTTHRSVLRMCLYGGVQHRTGRPSCRCIVRSDSCNIDCWQLPRYSAHQHPPLLKKRRSEVIWGLMETDARSHSGRQ